jgi:RNase adapter protein RapZ
VSEPAAEAPRETAERARLVLVTGMSGSGKSVVANAFEDLGFYTVDNLPLPLLEQFLERPLELVAGGDGRIAVVADLRVPGFAEAFPGLMRRLDRERVEFSLLFLDASDEVLVRRFSETRRPHPLAPEGSVIEGIRRERERMEDLRGSADTVFDTSDWTVHDLRKAVYDQFARVAGDVPSMVVNVVTFGFKRGIPPGSDLMFDVRFLDNPHFEPGLREQTGLDRDVREYLEARPEYGEIVDRLTELLLWLLPKYRREHRSYLSVAVGCTGGRHRSVAVGEEIKRRLDAADWPVRLTHRDAHR